MGSQPCAFMPVQVYSRVFDHAARKHAIAGSFFWMTAARSYEDYDGTTIYLTPPATPDSSDAQNMKMVELVCKHASDMSALNVRKH